MPDISWIMPVKNGMPYLSEALASIESQTYQDAELLVWDNASTDGTHEELRRWIPSRIPGTIVSGHPRGVGGALAGLVELSEAEFCARLDADDLACPDRLERQIAFLRSHPDVSVVGGQLEVIDSHGATSDSVLNFPTTHEEILVRMLTSNPIGHPSVVFRRESVLRAGNYRELPNVEDYDLWLRMVGTYCFANLTEVLCKYRVHDLSCTYQSLEKGELRRKSDAVFVEHSAALFGITGPEAQRLRDHADPFVLIRALKIARQLSSSRGGSVWSWLRRSSLLENIRSTTRSRDVLSRLALALIDKQSSFFREIRAVTTGLIRAHLAS